VRSIRVSLLVWFLGLLTLALGGLSLFVYHTSSRTLRDKKETTKELLRAQYKERCEDARKQLDKDLLDQARVLASTRSHFDWDRWRFRALHLYGLIGTDVVPGGWLLAPVWVAEGARSPISSEMARIPDYPWNSLADINDKDLREHLDVKIAQFYQIDSARGNLYRSGELRRHALFLPWEREANLSSEPVAWAPFEAELESGLRVRAVVLKIPEPRLQPPQPGRGPRVPFTDRADRPSGDLPLRPPTYWTCATDLSGLNATLREHERRYGEDVAEVEAKTQASLGDLRNRLFLLGTLTLLGVVVGTVWIVRRGLAPLDRLSDAVRRVSPKDFRLPFGEQRLPAELSPIVGHLKETLGQLRRAFEREKQATADISHELRTPLAALLTTTEIALRKPRTAEEYRELLGDCRLSAQQMNQAVERLLTLARLDAGVDQLRPQAVDAAALAEQCAAVVRPLAEARNLTLHVHRNGPVPLTTDPDKLREVVTNLLHNAVEYNRPQGSIDLKVRSDAGRLQLEVCDTGIGIAAEARERIFERFYRADPSRGADGLHAGLGLAIVKEYVRLMGGSIDVESAVGVGSTFRINLPAAA
jgi:heavy metal sensor kinase